MSRGRAVPYGTVGLERLAREACKAMDRTMGRLETITQQMVLAASREAGADARDLLRRTCVVMDDIRGELPRLRAEAREIEARAQDRLRWVLENSLYRSAIIESK